MSAAEQGLMAQFDKEAHSFVIRIWRENQSSADGDWRGWVEHAQTHERRYFRETAEISPIIGTYLNSTTTEDTTHA